MKSAFICKKKNPNVALIVWEFHLSLLLLIVEYWFYPFFSIQGCLFNNIFVKNLPFFFFTRIGNACRIKCINKNPFNIYLHVHVVTWVLRFSIKYLREVVSYMNKTVVKTILRQILMKRFFSIWYTRVSLFRLKQILNFVS